MGKNEKKKKSKKFGIMFRLNLLVLVPLFAAMVILLVVSVLKLRSGLLSESEDAMEYLAKSVRAGYEAIEGEYSLDGTDLMKGDYNVTMSVNALEAYVEGSDADVTLCFGKTRRATTLEDKDGNKIVGTDITDEVWKKIESGKEYLTSDIKINDEDYVAAYVPIKDKSGKVIGAAFAGEPTKDVDEFISNSSNMIIVLAVVLLVIATVVCIIIAREMSKSLNAAKNAIETLGEGKLNLEVSNKVLRRGDEIGDIARSVDMFKDKLRSVIEGLQKSAGLLTDTSNELDSMAEQSNKVADDITCAIDDISKGALSQAEEIQTASIQVGRLGSEIENIVQKVEKLNNISEEMKNTSDESSVTMDDLGKSNDKTTDAIGRIDKQLAITNEAIGKISNATELITSISSQTSLLSLNASIESARAGEAGRGFAVVASEIQQLSAQSDEAAKEIQDIILELQNEAAKTISVMKETKALVDEQQVKVDNTRGKFVELNSGIENSKENAKIIKDNTVICDQAREQINEVISNLSAVSEENAASTQQTTASMEELNATINVLASSAKDLNDIAENLEKEILFFEL